MRSTARIAQGVTTAILAAAFAAGLLSCAYSPTENFVSGDFSLYFYRSIALSTSSGDPELTPISREAHEVAHRAVSPRLEERGYAVLAADRADLVLYAGRTTVPSEGEVLVMRVSDRARRKLVWQRRAKLKDTTPGVVAAAYERLAAQLPDAAGPRSKQ